MGAERQRASPVRAIAGDNVSPIPGAFLGMQAYILQSTGDTTRAAAIRKTLDATPDTTWMVHIARAYAYLATADTAKVLSEMEAGLARRELVAQNVPLVHRMFDPLRHSARFAAIVRKSGLEGRGLTGPNGGRPAP